MNYNMQGMTKTIPELFVMLYSAKVEIKKEQYSYSFKSKNNCCSIYMNKTFYGHTPNISGLLNLDRSDTHIHNIEAKICKVNNDSAT